MSGLWFGFSFCLFLQIENCVVKMACSWTCAYKIKAKWTKEGKTRTCLPFLFFLINIKITKQNFPGRVNIWLWLFIWVFIQYRIPLKHLCYNKVCVSFIPQGCGERQHCALWVFPQALQATSQLLCSIALLYIVLEYIVTWLWNFFNWQLFVEDLIRLLIKTTKKQLIFPLVGVCTQKSGKQYPPCSPLRMHPLIYTLKKNTYKSIFVFFV